MELILHHYDFSNYAEKARLALGYKGLAWLSMIIPPVAPKPDLTPLTGGYRRTSVLQIGADMFCDTRLSQRLVHELAPYPRIADWVERMRAFGHGTSSPMSAAAALNVAAAAQPATPRASDPLDEDPPLGSHVRIRANDYGRDPVEGELALIDTDEIAVRRSDSRLGDIVVHFPRLGYDLRQM